jgi:energy-coupling factor transporter ATP-binding protein EcfA2
MLYCFSATAFKTLQDVHIDLGSINVFVGANGSGKSNILEAVGLLGAAASGRVNDESLMHRGVRPGLPVLYKSSFRGVRGAQHIRLEAKTSKAQYLVSLWNPISEPSPDWKYKHESLHSGSRLVISRSPRSAGKWNDNAGLAALKAVDLLPDDPAGILLNTLKNYAIYSPDTPTLRGLEPDAQSREPVGLAGGRLPEGWQSMLLGDPRKSATIEMRRKSLSGMLSVVDWLSSVTVVNSSELPIAASIPQPRRGLRFRDKFMGEGRNVLSGYDASEGVLYLLYYSVLALHPSSPKFFAVDNFDQALNPRTAREFTREFCTWIMADESRQVLLTTHNPLVLDGLPLQDDRVRLFAVERSKQGKTSVRRVVMDEVLLSAAQKGTPLSQAWVNGHFGGVPPNV